MYFRPGLGQDASDQSLPEVHRREVDLEVAKRKALSPLIMREQAVSALIGGFFGAVATAIGFWFVSKTPLKRHNNKN